MVVAAIGLLSQVKRKKRGSENVGETLAQSGATLDWASNFLEAVSQEIDKARWLDREFRELWRGSRPIAPTATGAEMRRWARTNGFPMSKARNLTKVLKTGVDDYCGDRNREFLQQEVIRYAAFFSEIEQAPLTDEQITSCVNMESRLQVVAAAGSGKTSVMVAKAAYAVSRGLVAPEKILVLAFNTNAAKELRNRIDTRFKKVGIDPSLIKVATFHAFGLEVMGKASGKKPRVASWVEGDRRKLEKSADFVRQLERENPRFAVSWNLLKLVFPNDFPRFGDPDPVTYWRASDGDTGFLTLRNEVVKSSEEKALADWLFLHGVNYQYEAPYEVDVADSDHSQYQPDFFYPDADLYHEHFALDDLGNPPESFSGYLDGVKWKREIHREFGTKMFETTSAEIRTGEEFARLEAKLRKRGVKCEFNPHRSFPGRKPIEDKVILRTMLTFLTHFKSSNLSEQIVRQRLTEGGSRENRMRHSLFVDCFFLFFREWQLELEREEVVDFDDMLQKAADLIEAQPDLQEFDLVLVDEFQDTSIARMDLVRNLSNRPGVKMTAVGDDWQSINRFAGADVSVTKEFARYFGVSDTLRLTRTFRSPQSICDVSSTFVMKNPSQIVKSLEGLPNYRPDHISVLLVQENLFGAHPSGQRWDSVINTLHKIVREHSAEPGKQSVVVLARYHFELENRPAVEQFGHRLNIGWHTVHSSKGREADHIIVVGLNSDERFGFPSAVEDDRVLNLVMPGTEDYPHAEERRLFYVALTRAKKTVTLIADSTKPSAFLAELQREFVIPFRDLGGAEVDYRLCPRCGSALKKRINRTTQLSFFGCTKFPSCRHTEQVR